MLTRQECINQSLQWLKIADEGYKSHYGNSNLPRLAAAIAQTYATLAITASVEPQRAEDLPS